MPPPIGRRSRPTPEVAGPLADPDRLVPAPARPGRDDLPGRPHHRPARRGLRRRDHQRCSGVDPTSTTTRSSATQREPAHRLALGGRQLAPPVRRRAGHRPRPPRPPARTAPASPARRVLVHDRHRRPRRDVGIIAGYSRGLVDGVLGRLMDLILAFPLLLILLALSPVIIQRLDCDRPAPGNIAEVTYLILVLSPLRLALPRPHRARAGAEPARTRVRRGRGLPRARAPRGSCSRRSCPNLWAPVLVYATLLLPSFIAAEATLAFLGVGLVEPDPVLGRDARATR